MMDTVLNLGLNDATVEGLAEGVRRPALRLGQLSPLHPDVRLRRARRRPPSVRGDHRAAPRSRPRRHRGHRAHRRGLAARGRRLQGHGARTRPASRSRRSPQEQLWGAIGAVFGSWMNPRAITYRRLHDIPAELGHRRQRAGDGVRQHGRRLRHRRLLHPRPVDRREPVLRRVPGERAGRGRGRRHPHAAAAVQACAPSPARCPMEEALPQRLRRARGRCARSSSSTTATCRTSSSPSSRTSCTCCRPATASAPPRPACASPSRWRRTG